MHERVHPCLQKVPSGVKGLDDILGGGLPHGRPTLVCGNAGCGKTLLAAEFLVRGAIEFGEPGVLMTFEETAEDLAKNVASLGFDLQKLEAEKKIVIDYVRVERGEIEETGEYDLEGLFVRLGAAIESIGAKRVALDTIETLFAGLSNDGILRSEIRRLFRWLKEKGMTAVVTGEAGTNGLLTRHGLEEYISDCVIFLDHRALEQVSTRRLRVVKYRGSTHGTNEYPFLIDEDGISVLPVTSLQLDHPVTQARVSTGIERLDAMLGGEGFFRGSSILISGTAGTGKTSIAASFVDEACRRGERCLYFAFEESRNQLIRNMRSIGLDLEPHVKKDLLRFEMARPTLYGLEMHLAKMHKAIEKFSPKTVIVDPITNFMTVGTTNEIKAMLMRIVDFLKSQGVTGIFTSLTGAGARSLEETEIGISSLIDTWLLLRDIEIGGERNRGLYILKSRGMAHSNQIREFLLTGKGIQLIDAYLGPEGVLTGSARLALEARRKAATEERHEEIDRRKAELERRRKEMQSKVDLLQVEFQAEEEKLKKEIANFEESEKQVLEAEEEMGRTRKADPSRSGGNGGAR